MRSLDASLSAALLAADTFSIPTCNSSMSGQSLTNASNMANTSAAAQAASSWARNGNLIMKSLALGHLFMPGCICHRHTTFSVLCGIFDTPYIDHKQHEHTAAVESCHKQCELYYTWDG